MRGKTALMLPLLLGCVALAACETIGVPAPQSFNDRVGYALATHTAVLQTLTTEVRAGAISRDEAADYTAIADRARDLIDAARRIHATGDIEGASRQLALAITVLQELQAHLRE